MLVDATRCNFKKDLFLIRLHLKEVPQLIQTNKPVLSHSKNKIVDYTIEKGCILTKWKRKFC